MVQRPRTCAMCVSEGGLTIGCSDGPPCGPPLNQSVRWPLLTDEITFISSILETNAAWQVIGKKSWIVHEPALALKSESVFAEEQLQVSRDQLIVPRRTHLAKLHGDRPKAIGTIREELKKTNMDFRNKKHEHDRIKSCECRRDPQFRRNCRVEALVRSQNLTQSLPSFAFSASSPSPQVHLRISQPGHRTFPLSLVEISPDRAVPVHSWWPGRFHQVDEEKV